ncbi:MAG: hypothetical protein JJU18_03660 [Oceanicaulis sp.]|nr:hypothetical protein [Oceanicaulis sp.]
MAAMSVVVAILAITLETVTAAHETVQREGHVETTRTESASEAAPPQQAKEWQREWIVALSPRLGRTLPRRASDTIVDFDESDAALSLAVTRPAADRTPRLHFVTGVRTSPQYFDDRDPTSAAFGSITIGDNVTYRELVLEGGAAANQVTDTFGWSVRYQHTARFNDFFESHARSDNAITAGVRIRDVRTIMCDKRGFGNAVDAGACSNQRGVYLEGSFDVSHVWSSDSNLRRVEPSLSVSLYSRPILNSFRYIGALNANYSYYDTALTPDGDAREDFRIRVGGGIDFTDYLRSRGSPATASIGVEWQRLWSNDAGRQHERAYLVPSVQIKRPF